MNLFLNEAVGSESSSLEIDVYIWRYAFNSGACQK